MKEIVVGLFFVLIGCQSSDNVTSEHDLMAWLRKSPVEIGCILENKLGFRDSIFNCNYENYVNNGDPCKNTTEYYEGIIFPNELAQKIHPSIKSLKFDFENGELRNISITFMDSLLKEEIKEMFHLPNNRDDFPDNIMEINFGENVGSNEKPSDPDYTLWLSIVGFEHMGAGDYDCD